jgi:uncharacterized protein YjdB
VSPAHLDTFTGYLELVSATAYNAVGDSVPGSSFNWSVDDPFVATFTFPGLLVAVAPGSATITATDASVPARGAGTATVLVQ